jgi:hypothetical protein
LGIKYGSNGKTPKNVCFELQNFSERLSYIPLVNERLDLGQIFDKKIACGWIRRGSGKPIATVASRTRLNLMGALNLEIMVVTISSYER